LNDPYLIEFLNMTLANGNLIDIQDTSVHIQIENNIISGNNSENGINLGNSKNVVIENNLLMDHSHGINIYSSSNVRITDNYIFNNNYQGIEIDSSMNVSIENNLITNNTGNGVYIEWSSNITIINNNISQSSRFGIGMDQSHGNLIIENRIEYNVISGMHLISSHHNNIYRNRIWDHDDAGIWTDDSNYTQIIGNDIQRTIDHSIVQLNSHFSNIQDNYFWGGTGAMWQDHPSHLFVYNNTMVSGYNAIRVYHESYDDLYSSMSLNFNITIINNIIIDSNYGIRLAGTVGSVVANNILNVGNIGMELSNFHHGYITCNQISDFIGIGIYLSSINATVTGNQIENNMIGLSINSLADRNLIEWNNFENNEFYQAVDEGLDNLFINNFWSDGKNSDLDNNEIVDDKYSLKGGAENEDNYPILNSINLSDFCNQGRIGNVYPSIPDLITLYSKKYPYIPITLVVILLMTFNEIQKKLKKKRAPNEISKEIHYPKYETYDKE
jgi:parallel beta-helix repeat protein